MLGVQRGRRGMRSGRRTGTRTASADTDVLVVASRKGLAHLLELSRFHGPD